MRQGSTRRSPRGRANRKQHLPSRSQSFDSNGPESRVRGNAHQVHERYLALARDATTSGDRILAESLYQFAEHYLRIMNTANAANAANAAAANGGQGTRQPDGESSGEPASADAVSAGKTRDKLEHKGARSG